MSTASEHASVSGRGDFAVTVPAVLVHVLAFVGVLAALALLPMAATLVPSTVATLPFGVLAVAALLATPVLAPLLIVGLLARLVE